MTMVVFPEIESYLLQLTELFVSAYYPGSFYLFGVATTGRPPLPHRPSVTGNAQHVSLADGRSFFGGDGSNYLKVILFPSPLIRIQIYFIF
jgi:hypothetical protein